MFRWEPWNDQISSLKVLGGTAAAFFEHENFGGKRLLVFGPESINNLSEMPGGWNDKISSVQIVPITKNLILENVIFPPG
ncbi:hypothetical protein S7335_1070 [Synechococcus sp. PCC 7335]|nr:hypothetical protein S7335_1070 [Synechococcus sp. PCC 7335]